jgi:TetR/AcrR family transcriptional regulator, transcriptional repressor for nem operon
MMARIVNKEEYESRRNEILDAAQRLVYTTGYEGMSIQDILAEVKISKGAFYHYFDSKQALFEALIERMAHQGVAIMLPIVQEEQLGAVDKLLRIFNTASRWKTDRKEYLLRLVKIWYADENTILRYKSQAAVNQLVEPLITSVICQGVREGVFHTPYGPQASIIIFTLLQSFGDALVPLMLQPVLQLEAIQKLDSLTASYQDAVERVLGAQPGSLPLFDTSLLREWFPQPNEPTYLTKE